MLRTELGARNGESRHLCALVSWLRLPPGKSWNIGLLEGVSVSGRAIALGATDAGSELIDDRLEAVSALSRAVSSSVQSLCSSVADDSSWVMGEKL